MKIKNYSIFLFFLCLSGFTLQSQAQNADFALKLKVRGIPECNLRLLALSGKMVFKPLGEAIRVKNGTIAILKVPESNLPGEFLIQTEYTDPTTHLSKTKECTFLMVKEELEIGISPAFLDNPDSVLFQEGERLNTVFQDFTNENRIQKSDLSTLHQFLMDFKDKEAPVYLSGSETYNQIRKQYNSWLQNRIEKDKLLFSSALYEFQFVPEVYWEGNEEQRLVSMIDHFFDGVDFNDSRIINTYQIREWMDSYVNLHTKLATSLLTRDSLITSAANKAIEKAKMGNPILYGWMVDYFFNGFESNNLDLGIKVLEPYLNDPDCPTTRRMQIERRLKGMETLKIGMKAPDIQLSEIDGKSFVLNSFEVSTPKILLLFWSADCNHCQELIGQLYPWYVQNTINEKLTTVAISLDETETEIFHWKNSLKMLSAWKHLRAENGIKSKVAEDYFLLSTPVMFLLDSKSKQIIAMPQNVEELKTINL